MNALRTLIVDDEPAARRGLRARLSAEAGIEVVGECGDGASAIVAIGELAPDLVFLDIQMPELGGFEVIDSIGSEHMPAVVFVTAYDQYALRAFEVHALDYVLKPVDPERLHRAVRRAQEQAARPRAALAGQLEAALQALGRAAPARWARRLAIAGPGRTRLVDLADVSHFTAAGNYVEVHATSGVHLLREPLSRLFARLDPQRFVRLSRSAVVAAEAVREVQPLFNGDFVVILRDGTQVNGSRRHRADLARLWD